MEIRNQPTPVISNIEAVARMEQQFAEDRSLVDRIADAISAFAGSAKFVIIHLVILAIWFLVNTGKLPLVKPWDPYPFVLLAMAVSVEAVLLSTFVLMTQNRMSRRADQRDHLHLQIALLAEKEITKTLQILQQVASSLGIEQPVRDPETRELAQHTSVDLLLDEIKTKLPKTG